MTRLKCAAYVALVAYSAIWCGVQVYLTLDYIQERAAIVEARR